MITLRRSRERGHFDHGWLDTYHTFSFANYHDPRQMGFHALRVMNEDTIAPGEGFGKHPHRDMEIVTYVLDGALAHRDSMGHVEVLGAGEFQRMSAGTGITHSEFNASASEPVHLYQIWLLPDREGIEPSYEQRNFSAAARKNKLRLVASPDGEADSLRIQQDARVYLGSFDRDGEARHPLGAGRHAWIQVLRGSATVNGQAMAAGDGAAISEERQVAIQADTPAEVMLFDLA